MKRREAGIRSEAGGGLVSEFRGLAAPYDRRSTGRWTLSHAARYKVYCLAYLAGSLAWEVLTSAMPRVTGRAFDAVLRNPPNLREFQLVVLALLAIVLMRWLFGMATTYSLANVANGIERDMREELYVGLLGKVQTFFDRRRVGDLMARATNDAGQVNFMVDPGMEFLFIAVFGTIVPIAFIGAMEPELLVVPGAFLTVFVAVLRAHSRRLAPISEAMQERFGALNAHLTEALSGMELIASAGQQRRERLRFARNAGSYRDAFVRQGRVQSRYLPPLLLSVALAGAFLHGFVLVTRGQLSVGELVAYLGLVGLLGGPVGTFAAGIMMLRGGMAGSGRILDLLNDEAATYGENAPGHSGNVRGDIAFRGVTFGYDAEPVLKDISFHARPGETVAIVGPTGSGKSTLVKLINRTYTPDSGRVLVDGVDVQQWDTEILRSRMSVIEQDVTLFSRSIADNIAFGVGRDVDHRTVEAAARTAQAHEFIAGFKQGYDTVVAERGATLSGGQRQRLAIARALLTDPSILVLDDATSAVDSATEEKIRAAIRAVAAGRTTFLITHRLSEIRHADRVLVLDRGRLVDHGDHDQLMERCALYRRIFSPYE